MNTQNTGASDLNGLRLRNRVIPRVPPAAPRREVRSPRQRSPSEGAVSAYSQARTAQRLESQGPGVGIGDGLIGTAVAPPRSTPIVPLMPETGVPPPRPTSPHGLGRQVSGPDALGQRVENMERMLQQFLHERQGSAPPMVHHIMPSTHVHVPPPFSGHRPKSWLLQMEQYFTIVGVAEEEIKTIIKKSSNKQSPGQDGYMGFPGSTSGKESACQCKRYKRHGFDPWVMKIPWRTAW